ncbi:MAG TPA: DUF305 domain-containing protein [Gemmatimonadales bacterium]|nr:DUF305 domain-containing protein [Gemmatimonadales bacterium]
MTDARGPWWTALAAPTLMAVGLAACASSGTPAPVVILPAGAASSPAAVARADQGRPPYTRADADFMSGMISHHAQAVLMAGWAPSHGASASVRALCERIVVAQKDEIATMQRWLRERGEPVPEADPRGHLMPGMDHHMLMPGMLTPEQMTQLDAARGAEFDLLFLRFMIQHHEGALTMVETLFGSYGAAHDEDIFKLASDVHADQTSEIERMRTMLTAYSAGGSR